MGQVERVAPTGHGHGGVLVLGPDGLQDLAAGRRERGRHVGEGDPVLGPARAREARDDGAHVELEQRGVARLGRAVDAPQALLLGVGLDQGDARLVPAGQAQVVEGAVVDREEAAGGAVLGRHVRDGRAVGQGQLGQAVPAELDELAHDAVLAEDLDDAQHEVGRGRALGQLAGEAHAHHLGDEHRHRLPEHGGLGLDAAHAPAEHAEAVDHGRVAVGADQGVGEGPPVLAHDRPREVLQVHLVHDARLGRHDAEVLEGALAPLEELVALTVALELELGVLGLRLGAGVVVDLHGVVDHELRRLERVDLRRVPAERDHGIAHGC